jgi:hypothetical protein
MLLSGHQPVYLPGIILFNKIAISDAFMFVGHCQNVVNSWHTRNKIRVGGSSCYLSVPVKRAKRFPQSINETEIANMHWRRKHLLSIKQNYGKRPYFDVYFPKLEAMLMSDWATLGDMDIAIIKSIMEWLDIRTPVLDSRDYKIEGHRTDMIISMCRAAGADEFICNEGSRSYLKEEQLAEAGIQHYWQVFEHPVYDQGKPFIENLSIIDLLFNVGEVSREIVFSCGHAEPGPYRPKVLV